MMRLLSILLLLLVTGCSVAPRSGLVPTSPDQLPQLLDDGDMSALRQAVQRSLRYYRQRPTSARFNYGELSYTPREMIASMQHLLHLLEHHQGEALHRRIREEFHFFESRNEQGEAFFTGYYEPIVRGARGASIDYPTPLYAMPSDLIRVDLGRFDEELKGRMLWGKRRDNQLLPYDSRSEIVYNNSLKGRAEPLAYLENDIELFFLQIQGSGLVRTSEGELLRLNYAGQNGHSYFAIGRLLQDAIPPEQMSLQSIKQYLYDHPEEVQSILSSNPSYTFFRRVEEGPLGNIQVPLTPGRSVAMDHRLAPQGGLLWFESRYSPLSLSEQGEAKSLRRFGLIQDTGGAIRGHGRADLFWGSGAPAERLAGPMKESGRLFWLVARKEVLPSQ